MRFSMHNWFAYCIALCLALSASSLAYAAEDAEKDHGAKEHAAETEAAHGDEHADHGDAEHASDDHAEGHSDHGDDHSDHGEHGDDHGGHHETVPFYGDLALWGFVAFLGFVWAIKALGLWDSLLTNMDAREQIQRDQIATAESHLQEAQQSLTQFKGQLESMDQTMREMLDEAQRDANSTHEDIIATARKEAEVVSIRVKNEINRVKGQTLHELFSHMAEQVAASTEAVVREKFEGQDQDRLIDDALEQLV